MPLRLRFYFFRLALVFSMAASIPQPARADEVYTFIVKKQEAKKSTRWNLNDWLVHRDTMRLQDVWLALHASSPYEFIMGGDYRRVSNPQKSKDHRSHFQGFAKIFGLGVEREKDPTRTNFLFLIRLLGFHNQSTNITIHGGLRNQEAPEKFHTPLVGGSLSLYMTKYFGGEAIWRHYFPATGTTSGHKYNGNQLELNGFIDFRALRIYGGYLNQAMDGPDSSGYQAGAKLFF